MPASRFLRRFAFLLPGIAVLASVSGWATFRYTEQSGLAALQQAGRQRLALSAASLEREIDKYAYFPATLELQRNVLDMLTIGTPATVDINADLERLNRLAGTLVIYILNDEGIVVASSNWNRDDSFIGENLSYRAYFTEAMQGRNGRFFGIGTTRGETGYYLSSPLEVNGVRVGVAAVKISLGQLESSWANVEVPAMVTDTHGVVILTSVPEWTFKTLRPLEEGIRQRLEATLQYNARPLPPLGLKEMRALDDGAALVRIPASASPLLPAFPASNVFLAQSRSLPAMGWTLTVLSSAGPVLAMAWTRAALAAVVTVLACILLLLWNQRRQYLHARLEAREALQRAHDELERKVEERTRNLRTAQDELVHAGKLAVIGQLSTEMAHELNQPLAALSTLSGNAVKFMQRGDLASAQSNLERISAIVATMGVLTGRLKMFARKSSDAPQPAAVRRMVDNALFLLDRRVRQTGAQVVVEVPPDLMALCDTSRLEQVLVNLIANGLDAISPHPQPRLVVSAATCMDNMEPRVRITVCDNGPGIPDEVMPRLFEPFFTTKTDDRGLGLGLAISAGIVRECGGMLRADNAREGGAVFTVDIPAASA